MPFVTKTRKYYKFGTESNATMVGSVNINNGIARGFTTSSYLLTPKAANLNSANNFEINMRIQHAAGSVLQQNSNNPFTIALHAGRMLVRLTGTSGWTVVYENTSDLVTATWYYIRASFNGTEYKFERSTDGKSYVTLGTLKNSTKIIASNQQFTLGTNDTHADPFRGSIDLTKTYIKINGNLWWHGTKAVESNENDYAFYEDVTKRYNLINKTRKFYKFGTEPNVTVVGSPTVNNGVASGFSTSNYLTLPSAFTPSNGDKWESVFCFVLSNVVHQFITGNYWTNDGSGNVYYGYRIQCDGTNIEISYGFGTYYPIIHEFVPTTNTKYWIKSVFDGSSYSTYYSTNGTTYNLVATTQNSTIIKINSSYPQHIGAIYNGYFNDRRDPFRGSIDLTQSYIKINGKYWWTGTKTIESNANDYTHYEDTTTYHNPIHKKYYKYKYSSWTQPQLTSNGVMGGNSFAVSETGDYQTEFPAYYAFEATDTNLCLFSKGSSGYLQWYNPKLLRIRRIQIKNVPGDSWGTRAITSGMIMGGNDGNNFVEIKRFTNRATGGSATWYINMQDNTTLYKYYRLVITGTSYSDSVAANQVMIQQMLITAEEATPIQGTIDDHAYSITSYY